MTRKKIIRARVYLLLTLASAGISSFSLSLIPYINEFDGKNNIFSYIVASVFWFGWIVSFLSTFFTSKTLNEHKIELQKKDINSDQCIWGAFKFSFEWKKIILYALIVVGLFFIITDILFAYVPEKIMFFLLSITLFSFSVHCVIDGKNYKVYKLIRGEVK